MTRLQSSDRVKKKTSAAKPFLKWVGGKTQLLEQFAELYPQELKEGKITQYVELFVGGGAVFFDVVRQYQIERVLLNDINQDLILAYRVIRDNAEDLISILIGIETKYLDSDLEVRKDIFYTIRDTYNQQLIDFDYTKISRESIGRAAQLIFLNKTCFNGLYRTNKKGGFNVPLGKYKNPTICDRSNLIKAAKCLQNVELRSGSYKNYSDRIDANSFVYIDPPYRPINKTSSFTSYAKSGFNDKNQVELSQYYQYLSEVSGAKVMLSNSNPHNTDSDDNFFHNLYCKYHINEVHASRTINSNATKRGKITELVITNY